jgi:hypothetical protein
VVVVAGRVLLVEYETLSVHPDAWIIMPLHGSLVTTGTARRADILKRSAADPSPTSCYGRLRSSARLNFTCYRHMAACRRWAMDAAPPGRTTMSAHLARIGNVLPSRS